MCGGDADLARARRCLVLQARYAIEARIDFVQIRERDLEARDLAAIVAEAVAIADGTRTRVVVNERVDVALASGAAGVHLRGDSVPAAAVRSMTPPGFVIGRSVHGVEEAIAAAPGVDYLIAGAVWPTRSKPAGHAIVGVDGLAAIVRAVKVPILAIGGVTLERIAEAAATGVVGIAAIGLFMGPEGGRGATSCRAEPLGDTVAAARAKFDTPATPP